MYCYRFWYGWWFLTQVARGHANSALHYTVPGMVGDYLAKSYSFWGCGSSYTCFGGGLRRLAAAWVRYACFDKGVQKECVVWASETSLATIIWYLDVVPWFGTMILVPPLSLPVIWFPEISNKKQPHQKIFPLIPLQKPGLFPTFPYFFARLNFEKLQ